MKHPENDYIQAGYRYERAAHGGHVPALIARADTLRRMIESEDIDDRAEARRLIEQGRQEARGAT